MSRNFYVRINHKTDRFQHTLQSTGSHCNTLQHAATRCNTLHHTATTLRTLSTNQSRNSQSQFACAERVRSVVAVCCSVMQCDISSSTKQPVSLCLRLIDVPSSRIGDSCIYRVCDSFTGRVRDSLTRRVCDSLKYVCVYAVSAGRGTGARLLPMHM